jgi:dethiobiotin synthetase
MSRIIQKAFLVTGTDTDVGKTHVTCALLHATRLLGFSAIGMKPVAAGVEKDGRNSDVVKLLTASSIVPPLEWVNPFLYSLAIAPHIAAREEGRSIDIEVIRRAFEKLQRLADVLWVEGAGGLLVPFDDRHNAADLAQLLGLPIILVVGMRIGCLNHALLTAEAIRNRRLHLAGWIANQIDPDMNRFEANLESLQTRLGTPLLGITPFGTSLDLAAQALCLSILPGFTNS